MKRRSHLIMRLTLFMGIFLIISLNLKAYVVNHTLNFPTSGFSIDTVIIDNASYISVNYDNMSKTGEVGAPSLPSKVISFSVPYNACNFYVTLSNTQIGHMTLAFPVIPQQPQYSINDEGNHPFTLPSSTIYSTNSFYPSVNAKVISNGFLYGVNNVVNVIVYPVSINPYTKRLNFYKKMKVSLHYDLSTDPQDMTPMTRIDGDDYQDDIEIVKSLVVNSSNVEANAYNGSSTLWNGWDFIDTTGLVYPDPLPMEIDTCTMLCRKYMIITTNNMKPYIKRFEAYRRLKGLPVGVVTVEQILNHPNFQQGDKAKLGNSNTYIADSAGIIRAYLKYAFKRGTNYVMFAGKGVPFRYGQNPARTGDDKYLPTDLYFSELSSNWNITNDGKYGVCNEYINSYHDSIDNTKSVYFDYHPELYVGRLPASTKAHFNNYTDKLLRYELNPGAGDFEYLLKPFIFSMSSGGYATGQMGYVDEINHQFSAFSIYTTIMRESPYFHYPTGAQFIDAVNQNKPGIITFLAHGTPISIGVDHYGNNGNHRVLALDNYDTGITGYYESENLNGFDNIQNRRYPSIMIANSCTTMPFDIYTNPYTNYTYNQMNLGESFVLGKDYGGPAYLGHTRESYDKGTLFIPCVTLLRNEAPEIGKALAIAKEGYNNLYSDMITNLIGDPEMSVWTSYPLTCDTIQLERHDDTIVITGMPHNKKFITISSPSESKRITVYTTSHTITDVDPNSNIMINHRQYIPYIAPLIVQNCEYDQSGYTITDRFIAGNHVDENRTYGNVTVPSGTTCEVEVLKDARLYPGFKVKNGSVFKILPSTADIYGKRY